MDRCVRLASLVLCVIAGAAADVRAQVDGPVSIRSAAVTSISGPISIDGSLSEPAWTSAPTIGDLIQRQPDTGRPPTERTDVTLLRDEDNLYIGIHAYDTEPDRVVGTQMIRDASLNADDRIEIVLDTFRDQRSAFYFATNPAGALVDGLAFANGQLNTDWDAIWHVRTSRTSNGWTAEFAIPFKSLSFPAGENVWGFNIARTISRKLEDDRWSGARLDTQFLQVSEAGEISNLAGLTQGIGLDLRPFLAGRWLHLGDGRDEFSRKPGLDLFYSITPSLRLTATFNTDFGETEVDARQINLSRFSLLFPEKRAFFLEGAGVFSFASTGPETPGGIPGTGADLYPFFSRQVGLIGGREVPLDAGVKLTGTVGRTEIGVLSVRTRQLRADDNAVIADDEGFFIGRVKRNLFEQSYVGAIFTSGNPLRGSSGETYGVDARLATSRFLGRQRNFVVDGFAVRGVNSPAPSSSAGLRSTDDWSYGFSAAYPNDKFDAQIAVRDIQRNFRPALGFVQRDNVRLLRVGASYNPRPRFLNIQQIFHDFYYTQFTNLDNNLVESRDAYISLFDWHLRSGDSVHAILDFNPVYERLFEPFEISPGVFLPPGEYRFTRFRSNAASAARRRFTVSASVGTGSYWSGSAEQITASLGFKLPPRFIASVSTNQTFARLPEGNFITRIFTSNIGFTASPRLSFSNLIQYDNRSRNLGWQSRVRWTLQPGNDFFFSFNQGWIQDELENRRMQFRVQDSRVSTKFQYSHRF
jgi:hypothetical protein